MVDLNMLLPALIIVLITFVSGSCILNASGRKTAQRQTEAHVWSGDAPSPFVDDSASFGAWLLTLLVFLGGSSIATSLLFHVNPILWALALLH